MHVFHWAFFSCLFRRLAHVGSFYIVIRSAHPLRSERMPPKSRPPSELQEQIAVVRWLRTVGVLFCHVPNGGKRSRREAVRLKASGVVAGVPDLLIFDPPPIGGSCGAALEMKRQGSTPSAVSKVQKVWLRELEARGWASLVGRGAEDAIEQLRALGYGG